MDFYLNLVLENQVLDLVLLEYLSSPLFLSLKGDSDMIKKLKIISALTYLGFLRYNIDSSLSILVIGVVI
jgi:hypothetical protein